MPAVFQFHEGSINTLEQELEQSYLMNFNSMKVRLILPYDEIKSAVHEDFNSMKVRLILVELYSVGEQNAHFNSMKVRLIHRGLIKYGLGRIFQFHEGSINTYNF